MKDYPNKLVFGHKVLIVFNDVAWGISDPDEAKILV